MSLQSILQYAASIASLLNAAVLGVGYYFLIKLHASGWASGGRSTSPAGVPRWWSPRNIIHWEQRDTIGEEAIRSKVLRE